MSKFGWNYPAGAEHDPRAPWNEVDEEEQERRDRKREERDEAAFEDWKENRHRED